MRISAWMLALGLLAAPAHAGVIGGLDLAWDDCGAFGSVDKTFACTTNSGADLIVASIVAPSGMDSVVGVVATLEFVSTADPMPPWWDMGSTGCRGTSISTDFYTEDLSSCAELWNGQALGGYSYAPYYDPQRGVQNVARLRFVGTQPVTAVQRSAPGAEYYLAKIRIDHRQTVGPGACSGCATSGCIRFLALTIDQTPGDQVLSPITNVAPGGSLAVTWQSGLSANCDWVPVRNRTWGSVKALYR